MSEVDREDDPAARYVKAAADAVGIAIAPEHVDGVVDNMRRLAVMAALVEGLPLSDEVEPAPVFSHE